MIWLNIELVQTVASGCLLIKVGIVQRSDFLALHGLLHHDLVRLLGEVARGLAVLGQAGHDAAPLRLRQGTCVEVQQALLEASALQDPYLLC